MGGRGIGWRWLERLLRWVARVVNWRAARVDGMVMNAENTVKEKKTREVDGSCFIRR